jgi:hypothetical protein
MRDRNRAQARMEIDGQLLALRLQTYLFRRGIYLWTLTAILSFLITLIFHRNIMEQKRQTLSAMR